MLLFVIQKKYDVSRRQLVHERCTRMCQINGHDHASATPGYSTTRFHQSAGGSGWRL